MEAKLYRRGTHRTKDPSDTWQWIAPMLPAMGITRVGNITGLDNIGHPVWIATRPNSRSISVSQGKGLDHPSARVSAAMECVEGYHSEVIDLPLRMAPYDELKDRFSIVDPALLPHAPSSRFHPRYPLLWTEAEDLFTRKAVLVPYQLVHTQYTVRMSFDLDCFEVNSTGLASGNSLSEATVHALCEVIEREASARYLVTPVEEREQFRLDLDSVQSPDCRFVLDLFAQADAQVVVWNTTGPLGVPAFEAVLGERTVHPHRLLPQISGAGCHPDPEVALLRALTETAQSRLTWIAGSRDDLLSTAYGQLESSLTRQSDRAFLDAPGVVDFNTIPSHSSPSVDQDLEWLLSRLAAIGHHQALRVDLTKPQFNIPVVRMIVPGLHDQSWRQLRGRSPLHHT